jgi:hypothetical protein
MILKDLSLKHFSFPSTAVISSASSRSPHLYADGSQGLWILSPVGVPEAADRNLVLHRRRGLLDALKSALAKFSEH